jgi:hypothetical protein
MEHTAGSAHPNDEGMAIEDESSMAYRTPYRQLAFVPLLLLAVMLYLVTVDAVKRWFYRRFSPRRPTPMMNTRFKASTPRISN